MISLTSGRNGGCGDLTTIVDGLHHRFRHVSVSQMSEPSALDRLKKIGFEHAATWRSKDGILHREPIKVPNKSCKNLLYAFVLGNEVAYIGATRVGFESRMRGHLKPGKSQITNKKVNRAILKALSKGDNVDTYAFRDPGDQRAGEFEVDLAAGLERSLIDRLKPRLNDLPCKET
jgi:hypothetical protein